MRNRKGNVVMSGPVYTLVRFDGTELDYISYCVFNTWLQPVADNDNHETHVKAAKRFMAETAVKEGAKIMTIERFNEFMDFVIEHHIKGVMCKKSAEYAKGLDKLHNFKKAAQMRGLPPEECLRGMKLKHDVSIEDMLDDLLEKGTEYPQGLWQEKLHDQINYTFLLWALLMERYDWELK